MGAQKGRVYFEVTVADEGLCRVGWAAKQASLDLGTEPTSFGFGGTGMLLEPVCGGHCQGHAVAEQSACVLCADSTSFGFGDTSILGLKANIVI